MATVITYRLDLALRLIDTTSGRNISGRDVMAYCGENKLLFTQKANDILIFQNLPERQFTLTLKSYYYEELSLEVDLDALPRKLPLLEVQMVPGPRYPGDVEFLEIAGTLPGLRELSAVSLTDKSFLIREFDPRRRNIKFFNPHHLTLERVDYGLVNPDNKTFEAFRVVSQKDEQTVKADRILEMEFKNYYTVTPIVFGSVAPDGRYCLRFRDLGTEAKWLIRWVSDGDPQFRVVDFRQEEHPNLEDGGV